jgi:hypothetical protein
MIGSAGKSTYDSWDRTSETGQLGQVNLDRTAWTGEHGQNREDMSGQDRKTRTRELERKVRKTDGIVRG